MASVSRVLAVPVFVLLATVGSAVAVTSRTYAESTPSRGNFDIRTDVLGFSPREFEQILEMITSDQDHLLAPSNDAVYGTPLANLYIRLQRYLFKKGVLPVDEFGRPQPGKDYKEDWSEAPHLPRLSINRFWDEVQHMVPPNSRCMEHFPSFYTKMHPHCSEYWTFDYEGDSSKARIDLDTKTLYDDVANLTTNTFNEEFDVIVATQVLELPSNPYKTVKTWFKMLKPGGLLFTTQPFCERDVMPSTGWPDNFRFTDLAVENVLTSAGFEVETMYMGGNTQLTTGFILGYGIEDFSQDELAAALYHRNDSHMRTGVYYGTYAVARKPVTAASSTAASSAKAGAATTRSAAHSNGATSTMRGERRTGDRAQNARRY